MLHCGARAISRAELKRIPCPEHTETWHPISHIDFVKGVERVLGENKMEVTDESYGVTPDGGRMFGLLEVARPGTKKPGDYAYVVGLRGSHDKTMARGVAIGASVFVCDNLSFSGEITFTRKSTKFILGNDADEGGAMEGVHYVTLPTLIKNAIGQLHRRWDDQSRRFETYKHVAVDNRDAAYMLMEMAGNVFTEQKLPDIYKEFKEPRHEEFVPGNLWTMFNAVTEFLKPREDSAATGLWTLPARTSELHRVCDDFAGLVIAPPATAALN